MFYEVCRNGEPFVYKGRKLAVKEEDLFGLQFLREIHGGFFDVQLCVEEVDEHFDNKVLLGPLGAVATFYKVGGQG
jgi:hypothetical protein